MSQRFTIKCSDDWCDVTDEVDGERPPRTLARPQGVGALQFSVAAYLGGDLPNPPPQDLLSLLADFARSHQLGDMTDVVVEGGHRQLAAASFSFGEDYLRVWYASDGKSFAKVTHTSAWGEQHSELPDCERMVRTLQFECFWCPL